MWPRSRPCAPHRDGKSSCCSALRPVRTSRCRAQPAHAQATAPAPVQASTAPGARSWPATARGGACTQMPHALRQVMTACGAHLLVCRAAQALWTRTRGPQAAQLDSHGCVQSLVRPRQAQLHRCAAPLKRLEAGCELQRHLRAQNARAQSLARTRRTRSGDTPAAPLRALAARRPPRQAAQSSPQARCAS